MSNTTNSTPEDAPVAILTFVDGADLHPWQPGWGMTFPNVSGVQDFGLGKASYDAALHFASEKGWDVMVFLPNGDSQLIKATAD